MLPDRSVLIGQKLLENAKIHKFNCDILGNFQTFWFWMIFQHFFFFSFGQIKALKEANCLVYEFLHSKEAAAHVLSFFFRQNVSFFLARKRKFFAHSASASSSTLASFFPLCYFYAFPSSKKLFFDCKAVLELDF